MKSKLTFAWTLMTALLLASPGISWGQEKIDFVKQIKPILEKSCFECHGADEDEYEAFLINIKDEALAYIETESAEDSDLYLVTVSDDEDWRMPPPDYKHQLTEKQTELIKQWIDEGADWPDDVVFVVYEEDQDTAADPDQPQDEEGDNTEDMDEPATGAQEDASTPAESVAREEDEEKKAKTDPKTQQILNAVGSLHPAAIHLPIGLLLGAGLFALFGLRGNFVMSDCAYYCLWLGSLGAIAATVTGWYFSPMENRGTVETFQDLFNAEHKVYWHRTGALVVTIFSFILALFAASARSKDPDEGVMWKLGTILLACGIGWVGHTGGELHYPKNHYKDLNAVWNELVSGVTGTAEEAEDADSDSSPNENASDESQIGTTSEGESDPPTDEESSNQEAPDA